MGEHRPDPALEDAVVHREIVERGGGVAVVRRAAAEIVGAVAPHMHARGIDGQRQIPVEGLFRGEDEAVAPPRLDRQVEARHAGGDGRPRAGRVDHGPG